ncbi:Helix-turn-helix domain-containing protein [Actinokineospora iranica]|uniref:Helix-turn-helix domain-containing protein n=1 Tax=Actinokineospora iranica TaxID=1271860 RepID=A0A1G6VZA4_9PSEU|nr:Helix-turn-helix domain-containing protein [Actinokineospora iranica]
MGSVVGENLRRLREQSRMTQHEAARLFKQYGLRWSRSKVAAIEAGDRETVSLADVLLLAFVFKVSIDEFFAGDGDVILADQLSPVPRGSVIAIIQGHYPEFPRPQVSQQEAEEREHQDVERLFEIIDARNKLAQATEADQLLARRLGVSVDEVLAASLRLWGRTLTDERNARVVGLGDDLETGERQAHRGHITRELSQQVEDELSVSGPSQAEEEKEDG